MALKMEIYYLESKSTSAHDFGIVGDASNELLSERNEARPFFYIMQNYVKHSPFRCTFLLFFRSFQF